MKAVKFIAIPLILSGCGTYVPNFQEFPLSSADGINLIRGITQSIECEIRRATINVIDTDKRVAALNQGIRSAPWIDDWGVQISLTLTIVESSSLTPGISAGFPSVATPQTNLSGSLPLSAKASRTGTMNYYYRISDLYEAGPCEEETIASLPSGSRFIRSDLKMGEWLQAQALSAGTGAIPINQEPKALTQKIEFVATYGGSVKATWPTISNSVSAITLSTGASRTKTHSLTMTFGKADDDKKGLSGSAADAFLAAQIGAEIRASQ
ncbi:MAG: hypothetical protein ACSHYC_25140 [Alphaproteobacteria bacterium]